MGGYDKPYKAYFIDTGNCERIQIYYEKDSEQVNRDSIREQFRERVRQHEEWKRQQQNSHKEQSENTQAEEIKQPENR